MVFFLKENYQNLILEILEMMKTLYCLWIYELKTFVARVHMIILAKILC